MSAYELFIGLRYTRAKRRNHFISFISLISLLGITLGMTALITVMSVMNGFQKEVRTRILGVASHVQVSGRLASVTSTSADAPSMTEGCADSIDGKSCRISEPKRL